MEKPPDKAILGYLDAPFMNDHASVLHGYESKLR